MVYSKKCYGGIPMKRLICMMLSVIIDAVNNALKAPYEVTQSSFTD